MNDDGSKDLKENSANNRDFDLEILLSDYELFGIYITILGYMLLAEGAKETKRVILLEKQGVENITDNSAITSSLANKIILIGITLLSNVAFSRLQQEKKGLDPTENPLSISGVSDTYIGYAINVLAEAYKVIGSEKIISSLQNIDIE
ncbi:hypothetical protein [Clostridium sp.]|uniref:hypothetical protein n=1 Tax=Clostridium sp. TaxID=1506 RepID=UPI003463FBF7